MPQASDAQLALSDCICPICREILLEPVTLPCDHTLCNPCFQLTVEKANLCCPLCRRRVSSWARYHTRQNTLINVELWERVQQVYPEECQRRASGQDVEMEDPHAFYPPPLLSKPGELREEYEAQIGKCEAERQAREEEERKASEEYIRKLLAEEEEENRKREQQRREEEEQLKRDEELARVVYNKLNIPCETEDISLASPVRMALPRQNSSSKGRKAAQKKASTSDGIQRYLSPTAQHHVSSQLQKSQSCSSASSMESSFTNAKSSLVMQDENNDDEEEPKMPTLSPQKSPTFPSSVFRGTIDLRMPELFECSEGALSSPVTGTASLYDSEEGSASEGQGATNHEKELHTRCKKYGGSKKPLKGHYKQKKNGGLKKCNTLEMPFVDLLGTEKKTLKVLVRDLDYGTVNCTENGMTGGQDVDSSQGKGKQKRKCHKPFSADGDLGFSDKKRRITLGNNEEEETVASGSSLGVRELMEVEKELYEKYKQEEADRKFAMQLQKQLNREHTAVNRQKGSPDEYELRHKVSSRSGQRNQSNDENSRRVCSRLRSSKSYRMHQTIPDETGSPLQRNEARQGKRIKSPACTATPRRNMCKNNLNALNSGKMLQNSSKQQTILQMFQKHAAR